MAARRSEAQLRELARFVQGLYALGGYATWKEFADQAGVHPVQLSDYQTATSEPSGWSLYSLIRAAAERAQSNPVDAAVSLDARRAGRERAELGESVAELLAGQKEILRRVKAVQQRERDAEREAAPKRRRPGQP